MDESKRKKLESEGWKIGDAADFLEMTPKERDRLDRRVAGLENVMSGDLSDRLWRAINKITKKKSRRKLSYACWDAIYTLGCHCQDLEHRLNKALERIEKLENKG